LIDRESSGLCTNIKVHRKITLSSDHNLLVFSLESPEIRTDTLWGQTEKYISNWSERKIESFQKTLNKQLSKLTKKWDNLSKDKNCQKANIDLISDLLIDELTSASSHIRKKKQKTTYDDITRVPEHVETKVNILIEKREKLIDSLQINDMQTNAII
jgi:hypothetical protein